MRCVVPHLNRAFWLVGFSIILLFTGFILLGFAGAGNHRRNKADYEIRCAKDIASVSVATSLSAAGLDAAHPNTVRLPPLYGCHRAYGSGTIGGAGKCFPS
jgi:hypothetical protein